MAIAPSAGRSEGRCHWSKFRSTSVEAPGSTLGAWLRTHPSLREVVRVLVAAGRGLVAAHTAGVLHRDFKPANVMVSPDGRVRVVDFGLARAADGVHEGTSSGASPASSGASSTSPGARSPPLAAEPTETSLFMGTPGYIAPEMFQGAPADALTDQYAYAVTALVALTRQRPSGLTAAIGTSPERVDWPREVPRSVRRIVLRGLSADPAQRYPSVLALVDALEAAVSRQRGHGAAVVVALSLVVILGGAAVVRSRASRATCQVAPETFRRVWDPERRAQLRQALVSTRRSNAEEAFELLAGRLDAFQARWVAMKQESCEATLVRGEQSEKLLALANACLEGKLPGVAALVDAFSRSEPSAVDRAAGATPEGLDDCADTAALLGTAERLPADPDARARIARIEAGLPVARALGVAGRWKEGGEKAEQLLQEARAVGHGATIARALRMAGWATYSRARTAEERKQGEAYLREAIPLAARAGDDRVLSRASSYLFELTSYAQRRVSEAEAMLPHVDALVVRAGDPPGDRAVSKGPRPTEQARAIELAGEARELWRQEGLDEQVREVERWLAERRDAQN